MDRSISFMEISEINGVSNPLKSTDVRLISLKILWSYYYQIQAGCLSYIFLNQTIATKVTQDRF
jgi:hypothetical protein